MNENATQVDAYFDDVKMTYTPGNVIQSSEYYPFGMQTASSWTRDNVTGNNFLGNGGTELNTTSQVYDLDYRNYDPILGRMNQVDPLADSYSSTSPYHYAGNNPININDPTGAEYAGTGSPGPSHWSRDMEELSGGNKPAKGMGVLSAYQDGSDYFSPLDIYGDGHGMGSGWGQSRDPRDYYSTYGREVADRARNGDAGATQTYAQMYGYSISNRDQINAYAGYFNTFVNQSGSPLNIDGSKLTASLLTEADGRPDLGRVGNAYRLGLSTDFQKTLFENYWLGKGDYKLSKDQFYDIVSTAFSQGKIVNISETTYNGQRAIGATVSFYGSEEYARALGTATIYVGFDNGNPIGFKDTYDFNPLPWGERSYSNEILTRMINSDGQIWGAKDFKITYP